MTAGDYDFNFRFVGQELGQELGQEQISARRFIKLHLDIDQTLSVNSPMKDKLKAMLDTIGDLEDFLRRLVEGGQDDGKAAEMLLTYGPQRLDNNLDNLGFKKIISVTGNGRSADYSGNPYSRKSLYGYSIKDKEKLEQLVNRVSQDRERSERLLEKSEAK